MPSQEHPTYEEANPEMDSPTSEEFAIMAMLDQREKLKASLSPQELNSLNPPIPASFQRDYNNI